MASSSKVFVYQGDGAKVESTNDLYELLHSDGIFPTRPDIVKCDFKFSIDGLKQPTFVVPGGSAIMIGVKLKPIFEKIKAQLNSDFNYIGVCAGAFIGTSDSVLFSTTHTRNDNPNILDAPIHFTDIPAEKISLGLISDYKAIGSFYPNDTYLAAPTPAKNHMPYRVQLSITAESDTLSQLYVSGPGFMPINHYDVVSESDVIARYKDKETYSLKTSRDSFTLKDLPAIIQKLPTETAGGVLLAGTHIEGTLKNSEFCSFFKTAGKFHTNLSADDYDKLCDENENGFTHVVDMIRRTITPAGTK